MSQTRVMDYETGRAMAGRASDELVAASAEAEPTGAVPAYRDERGEWQYVQPSMVDQMTCTQGASIVTVYVEEIG